MSTLSRIATRAIAIALAGALAGCGSIWPWSAPSKPPMPQPPEVATAIPAKLAWTYRLAPGGAGFMPAYSGGSIFAASAAGAVVRLDAATGREAWRVDLGKKIVAGVGSDGRAVAVALEDGVLVALDVSGKQRWSASLGADAVTVPAVGEGLVVVRTGDNRVQAFDLASGKRRWIFSRQNPPLVLVNGQTCATQGSHKAHQVLGQFARSRVPQQHRARSSGVGGLKQVAHHGHESGDVFPLFEQNARRVLHHLGVELEGVE